MEIATQNRRKMRGTTAAIQQVARAMRKDMTPAEQALWGALSGKQLNGLRFRAQHSAGQFILDFYCPLHKLVIEVDGSIHAGNEAQDAARTAHLNAYGYRVIRFRNEEICEDLPEVLRRIALAVSALEMSDASPLAPPLSGAGGVILGQYD